jgi:hypothetical protein
VCWTLFFCFFVLLFKLVGIAFFLCGLYILRGGGVFLFCFLSSVSWTLSICFVWQVMGSKLQRLTSLSEMKIHCRLHLFVRYAVLLLRYNTVVCTDLKLPLPFIFRNNYCAKSLSCFSEFLHFSVSHWVLLFGRIIAVATIFITT